MNFFARVGMINSQLVIALESILSEIVKANLLTHDELSECKKEVDEGKMMLATIQQK